MPTTATTTVALQISSPDNPLLFVPVTVNGRGPYDFVVDTGASHVVIDTNLADELGLRGQDAHAGHGAGGPITAVATEVAELCVAGACAVDLAAVVTDLSAVSQAAGVPMGGVLGHPFLSRYVVTIDYPNRQMHLTTAAH